MLMLTQKQTPMPKKETPVRETLMQQEEKQQEEMKEKVTQLLRTFLWDMFL
jgi:hypothetical protein